LQWPNSRLRNSQPSQREKDDLDECRTITLTYELHPDWADYASRTGAGWTKMLDALAATLG
jgi:hypothetical protein